MDGFRFSLWCMLVFIGLFPLPIVLLKVSVFLVRGRLTLEGLVFLGTPFWCAMIGAFSGRRGWGIVGFLLGCFLNLVMWDWLTTMHVPLE